MREGESGWRERERDENTGGQSRTNRLVQFLYRGKKQKTKFQLFKPGAQLSIV